MPSLLLAATDSTDDSGGLISVVPGLMVWTLVTFFVVLFVLRRVAFGPVQRMIDQRRDRIREALDEADKARQDARALAEQVERERAEARGERERLLEDARRQAEAQLAQAREQADQDLQRRLEENRRAIDAENRRLREQIRRDVVELTLTASEKVTGKILDAEDQRRLIDETIQEVDLKRIASEN